MRLMFNIGLIATRCDKPHKLQKFPSHATPSFISIAHDLFWFFHLHLIHLRAFSSACVKWRLNFLRQVLKNVFSHQTNFYSHFNTFFQWKKVIVVGNVIGLLSQLNAVIEKKIYGLTHQEELIMNDPVIGQTSPYVMEVAFQRMVG